MFRDNRPHFWRVFCLLIAGITVCSDAQDRTPEDEITDYAVQRNGEWDAGVLWGDSAAIVTELNMLSPAALSLITGIGIAGSDLEKVPDLHTLPSLVWLQLSGNGILETTELSRLKIRSLFLNRNPISDIGPIAACSTLEYLNLSHTKVSSLPNLSKLSRLTELNLMDTPLTSLKGIETVASAFNLNVMGCSKLTNVDSLLSSRVKTLFIDQENYDRLAKWFKAHDQQIKARRPPMRIRFEMVE